MIKLIRTGVFETNSSSCHTISVGSSGVYEGFTPNSNGEILLEPGEYGWEVEQYTNVESRLNYVMLYVRDWVSGEEKKYEFRHILEQVVFEHTGATKLDFVPEENPSTWGPAGYIDHQSVADNDLDFLFKDSATLKSFLFDRDSYIQTDNDNH